MGRLSGKAAGGCSFKKGDDCLLFIRPEKLALASDTVADNAISAKCVKEEFEGSAPALHEGRRTGLTSALVNSGGTGPRLQVNGDATIAFAATSATVLPADRSEG
ncbi:hypothetical protein [Breoghania sp.]|uniref:hypothetical protein n=1 Tax=Breoghania sp. TaxID=2065378 RepID=UPI0026199897|nr:hypothetical protein [Breoghania sp.]MDJ0929757.1 hypothetical protein [Breoghania sp.]